MDRPFPNPIPPIGTPPEAGVGVPPSANGDQAIDQNALCLRCGYDLFGLSRRGRCPECGAPAELSIHGDQLRYYPPAYVQRLRRGASNLLIGVGVHAGYVLLGIMAALTMEFMLVAIAGTLAAIAAVVGTVFICLGAFQLTTRPPVALQRESPFSARRWVRYATGFGILTCIGLVFVQIAPLVAAGAALRALIGLIMLANLLVAFIGMLAYLKYIGRLAGQLSSPPLRAKVGFVQTATAWLIGISVLGVPMAAVEPYMACCSMSAWLLVGGAWCVTLLRMQVELLGELGRTVAEARNMELGALARVAPDELLREPLS